MGAFGLASNVVEREKVNIMKIGFVGLLALVFIVLKITGYTA